jgi:hypothetical protein
MAPTRLPVRQRPLVSCTTSHQSHMFCKTIVIVEVLIPGMIVVLPLIIGNLMDDLLNLSFNDTPPPPAWGAAGTISLGQSSSTLSSAPSTPTSTSGNNYPKMVIHDTRSKLILVIEVYKVLTLNHSS